MVAHPSLPRGTPSRTKGPPAPDAENVNAYIHHRATPFHMACANGDTTICDILLGRGADLRASGPLQEFGETPVTGLEVARARGHAALVEQMERLLAHFHPPTSMALPTSQVDTGSHSYV
jgi:hypothetical protein